MCFSAECFAYEWAVEPDIVCGKTLSISLQCGLVVVPDCVCAAILRCVPRLLDVNFLPSDTLLHFLSDCCLSMLNLLLQLEQSARKRCAHKHAHTHTHTIFAQSNIYTPQSVHKERLFDNTAKRMWKTGLGKVQKGHFHEESKIKKKPFENKVTCFWKQSLQSAIVYKCLIILCL